MKKSLSIVVPVHNVQSTIGQEVDRLLEIAADLTSDFEVLIIDNGSTDGTEEAVYEITCRYPQVRSRRFAPKQGMATAIDLGISAADGEIVMIQDLSRRLSPADLRSLWEMHQDVEQSASQPQQTVQATTIHGDKLLPSDPAPLNDDLLQRLSAWGADISELEPLPEALLPEAMSNEASRNDEVRPPAPKLKMPRFLQRLSEFATGE